MAMFDQFVADLDIVCRWCTRTQFAKPLLRERPRNSPKAEHRNVNCVSFAGQLVFDEIASTSQTVMLNNGFTGLDVYAAPFGT